MLRRTGRKYYRSSFRTDCTRSTNFRHVSFEPLESRTLLASDYTLQILHASDLEGGVPALDDAPRFSAVINGLRDDFANTVVLSSGDNWIPGPFFTASDDPSLAPIVGASV
jgi:2',3'-cyclic-nucleotide 2'-phosphodiesterase (5'-nucleotidase family)